MAVIVGSLRRDSFNRKLAPTIAIFNLGERARPFFRCHGRRRSAHGLRSAVALLAFGCGRFGICLALIVSQWLCLLR